MAIYEINKDKLKKINQTKFSTLRILERQDLQQILKESFFEISPDTLIIAEEFGQWEDSQRRIDLLGVDKNGNLVVIELKRTEDGGHMDLQSIRYAAMISTLTFEKVVDIYQAYLNANNKSELDAENELLTFLDWAEESEEEFAQDVRIILVSSNFSKEVTTSVMWLLDKDIDIRCIRIIPYMNNGTILVDIQQIIPLPEITDYQVKLREKEKKEKHSRESKRDLTKYDVVIEGVPYEKLAKRNAIFKVVKALCDKGADPEIITELIPWRSRLFWVLPGTLNSEEFSKTMDSGSKAYSANRRFDSDEELIHWNGKTYALTNQWGTRTKEAIDILLSHFKESDINVTESTLDS